MLHSLGRGLLTPSLLRFQVFVQQVECLFVSRGTAHDREHAFASLVVGCLGDRDACTRALADLTDLGSSAANDATDHVCRNADVLGLDLLAVLGDHRDASASSNAFLLTVEASGIGEVGAAACAIEGPVTTIATDIAASTNGRRKRSGATDLHTNSRIVEDSTSTTLPVVDETLANLPGRLLDAFGSALDLNDALGGLWEHLFLCDHANARDVLDVLDLETLSADDRAHLVVRNQETDSYVESA